MLNTLDMYGICHEIYRDLKGKNAYTETDESILNFIFRLYNTTEIDCEEIKALWIEWLIKGTLSINMQIRNARNRIGGKYYDERMVIRKLLCNRIQ